MRIFWTDGSASPNPGPGGFAVLEAGKPVALGVNRRRRTSGWRDWRCLQQ